MRDDRARWTPTTDLPEPRMLGTTCLSSVALDRQTLISGPDVQVDSAIGWPKAAKGETYTLSLRRDRVVEINGPERTEGWDAKTGHACSDITDAFAVLELDGPLAIDLLKRGTEVSLDQPSASAARKLFGLDVWLYRHDTPTRFRLHVARAYEQALIDMLSDAAALMPDG